MSAPDDKWGERYTMTTTKMIIDNNLKKTLTPLQQIAFENLDLPNSKLAKKLGRSPQNTNTISKTLKAKLERLEYDDAFIEDACMYPDKYLISSKELSAEIMKKVVSEYGRITVTNGLLDRDRTRLCEDPVWRNFLKTPSEKMWETYPFNLIALVLDLPSEELAKTGYVNVDSDVQRELAVMWVNDIIKTCQIAKRFDIVEMRYQQHMGLVAIGEKYHITRNRVREILAKFIRQMRHPTRSRKLRFVTNVLFNTRGEVNFADIISKYEREMTEKEIVRDLAEKNGNVKLDDITIEELDFSVRTFNCLKRSGINNVEELVDAITTKTEIGFLCDIRNIGKKSYGEIKDKLISKGFLKE
jgi:hypothetical protein